MAGKLRPPSPRREWVARPDLIRSLDLPAPRLILVEAPAGYGKTTLLAQWAAAAAGDRPFAWVSLDQGDNDPHRLWRHVVAALQRACPQLRGTDLLGPLRGHVPRAAGTVVTRIVSELAAQAVPVVLVLDDYHLVTEPACHRQVRSLLMHVPPPATVAVSTRTDPPLPLGRLRATGDLAEIRMPELRFTAAEAGRLISAVAAVRLGQQELDGLADRAEGWPAGIYLAALSLRGEPDPGAFAERFSGSNRFITDFLTEEVLASQPPGLRQFLLRTSVLGRFTAPLCEAVAEAADAAGTIELLERDNMFVVPLDDNREWFRYHHWFAQVLLSRLARADPDAPQVLHQRASDWHREHGDPGEAISHALAAGNTAAATGMIARHWYGYADAGRAATVRGWLRALGDDQISASPLAAHCAAWVAALAGERQAVSRWLPVIEAGGYEGVLPDGMRSLRSSAALLGGTFGFGGLAAMRESAALAVELENDAATPWFALARAAYGTALYFSGETATAIRVLDEALAAGPSLALIRLLSQASMSLAALEEGRLGQAQQAAQAALELTAGPASGIGAAPQATLAPIADGAVRAAQGQLVQARSALEGALQARRRWPGLSPWPTLELLLRLAPVLLDLGERGGAAGVIDQAGALLAAFGDGAGAQHRRLERLERRLPSLAQAGSPAEPLTERELGVLRLLRGSLSLPEIGQELEVSANTIKSHTRAIYRKIGASGREEAVTHGRELGLL